ncbi:MAG: cysteine hydrolase family protein, partial [Bacteroidota bacterium]
LIVDVQQGLDDPTHGRRSTPDAEANMARLLAAWREAGWPVVHVKHNSTVPTSLLRPELPGNALKPEVLPLDGEPLFEKTVNSAFIGTGLDAYLRERGVTDLVIIGLTTDHCISTTARMAENLGFGTTVVADATAAFGRTSFDGQAFTAEEIHGVALANLHGEFATILTTKAVLAELARPA